MAETEEAIDELRSLMKKGDVASLEKIMDKFIVLDKNLILKTDIENSLNFSRLELIREDLKKRGLKKSSKTLEVFLEWYIKSRVPHKRQSWKYIFEAIGGIKREQASTLFSKITGMNKDSDNK